jgi:hypothetical protein
MTSLEFEKKIQRIFPKWTVKEYSHMGEKASGLYAPTRFIEVWETAFGNPPTCIKRIEDRNPTFEDVAELGKNHRIRLENRQMELIHEANKRNDELRKKSSQHLDAEIDRMFKEAHFGPVFYSIPDKGEKHE